MAFTLEVQFTGLCMHIVHQQRNEVAVFLPDAREHLGPVRHEDLEPAVAHVPLIRFNLAHLKLGAGVVVPAGEKAPTVLEDSPPVEFIHRFTRETLRFVLPSDSGSSTVAINMPPMGEVAPGVQPSDDLFAPIAGTTNRSWVLRTMLQGGHVATPTDHTEELWSIERRLLQPPQAPLESDYRGDVIWTRTVDAADMMLQLDDLEGGSIQLPLVPLDGVIRMKIANLCAENPLEWPDLPARESPLEDSDFKWFYKLLAPPVGGWLAALEGRFLPAPRKTRRMAQASGMPGGDCGGAQFVWDFPPMDGWQ